MTGILDRYINKAASNPAVSIDDVFGVELTRVLSDPDRVDVYRKIAGEYPHAVLADAAKRLLRGAAKPTRDFTEFYRELTHTAFTGSGKAPEIVAFKIERMAIGVAVFVGMRLSHTECRNLRYSTEEAVRSIAGIIRRMAEDHPDASFAFERFDEKSTRRAQLAEVALLTAREVGVPLLMLSPGELYAAYSSPPCGTREQMRAIVPTLFPHRELQGREIEIDALSIGVLAYCRVVLRGGSGRDEQ